MSAELVDPFATPEREQLKAGDMCDVISARITVSQQNDPPLCPQLVQKTLRELQRAATAEHIDAVSVWSLWLLEQLHHRAVSGIPYDEPPDPAWSMDSERGGPR